MRISEIKALLHRIADEYPNGLMAKQHADVDRVAFHIHVVAERAGCECSVCDIGGGIGLFSIGCAALGMRSILVDDFRDKINVECGASALSLHEQYGVKVLLRDVIKESIELDERSLDVVTSFDSMEHWHHSPKRLFHKLVSALKNEGPCFIGVPNAVNLRKRITVPLGIGKWSFMEDWYETDEFRGHVREPDTSDLIYIANDLNLKGANVFGRNWLGYQSKYTWVRALTPVGDRALRLVPSLCSDIYLLGRK